MLYAADSPPMTTAAGRTRQVRVVSPMPWGPCLPTQDGVVTGSGRDEAQKRPHLGCTGLLLRAQICGL